MNIFVILVMCWAAWLLLALIVLVTLYIFQIIYYLALFGAGLGMIIEKATRKETIK